MNDGFRNEFTFNDLKSNVCFAFPLTSNRQKVSTSCGFGDRLLTNFCAPARG